MNELAVPHLRLMPWEANTYFVKEEQSNQSLLGLLTPYLYLTLPMSDWAKVMTAAFFCAEVL